MELHLKFPDESLKIATKRPPGRRNENLKEIKIMKCYEAYRDAVTLYEGGWRSNDATEIQKKFVYADDEINGIIGILKFFETQEEI